MESTPPPPRCLRTYRPSLVFVVVVIAIGLVFALGGMLTFFRLYLVADTATPRLIVRLIGAGFAFLGAFVFLQAPFSKLELFDQGVRGGLFPFRQWIPVGTITSIVVQQGNPHSALGRAMISILIVAGRKRISWDVASLKDGYFLAWLDSLSQIPPAQKSAVRMVLR